MATILVIDDNLPFGETVAEALRGASHTVWHMPSGRSATGLLDTQTIDIVITDIVMPDEDGLEILLRLRRSHPQLKVIMMSGDNPKHAPLYLAIGAKLGAVRTLLKPFSVEALLSTVEAVLAEGESAPPGG